MFRKRRGQFERQFSIWLLTNRSKFLRLKFETSKRFGSGKWKTEKENEAKKKLHPVPCSGHKLVVDNDNQRKRNVSARVSAWATVSDRRSLRRAAWNNKTISNVNGIVDTRFTRNFCFEFSKSIAFLAIEFHHSLLLLISHSQLRFIISLVFFF